MEHIRVCASSPPYQVFITWYRSDEVWWWNRVTGEDVFIGIARSLDDFNDILYDNDVMPVGLGRKGKREQQAVRTTELLPF